MEIICEVKHLFKTKIAKEIKIDRKKGKNAVIIF